PRPIGSRPGRQPASPPTARFLAGVLAFGVQEPYSRPTMRSGPAQCGDVELFYEDLGDLDAQPVVLIMGVGAQLPMWPDGFCAELDKHGYRVIRFDHRDTGLSTKMRGMRAKGSVYRRVARYVSGRSSP